MYVVSSAHAWLARSIFTPRRRYGQILCNALRRLVLNSRYSASAPMRFISVRTRRRPTSWHSRHNRRASATFALNASECIRRVLLVISSVPLPALSLAQALVKLPRP